MSTVNENHEVFIDRRMDAKNTKYRWIYKNVFIDANFLI